MRCGRMALLAGPCAGPGPSSRVMRMTTDTGTTASLLFEGPAGGRPHQHGTAARAVPGAERERAPQGDRPSHRGDPGADRLRLPGVHRQRGRRGPGGRHPARGPPGFVTVLDDRTLAIPDATGNKRLDTLHNVVETGRVGLLFAVPGRTTTLRVNGRAFVSARPELLDRLTAVGKTPVSAIVVRVEQAYPHCPKSLMRGNAWQPDRWLLGRRPAEQRPGDAGPAEPAGPDARTDRGDGARVAALALRVRALPRRTPGAGPVNQPRDQHGRHGQMHERERAPGAAVHAVA